MTISACIEMLFAQEHREFHDRIRAAAVAGFQSVEFWQWRNKDLDAIQAAMADTGLSLSAMLAETEGCLLAAHGHSRFLDDLRQSLAVARRLGVPGLIVVSGQRLIDAPVRDQRAALVEGLSAAAAMAQDNGVTLLLEPLNSRHDRPGVFLDSTVDGLSIVEEIDRPSVRLLFDVYHSGMMGEDPAVVLAGKTGFVGHVHLADAPDRHEPGTGTVDWPALFALFRQEGYRGGYGLEFRPSQPTCESLRATLQLINRRLDTR